MRIKEGDLLMKFKLVESLTSDLEKIVKDHFIISNYPVHGASFILTDGSFVDLSESFNNNSFEDFPCHGEVDDYLFSIGAIEKPGDYSDGSPSIQNVGAIRINDVEEDNNYVELSPIKPTSSQFNSLEAWLDMNQYHQVALCTPGMNQHVIYSLDDVDYIIKRIRRYYASGQLYEGVQI